MTASPERPGQDVIDHAPRLRRRRTVGVLGALLLARPALAVGIAALPIRIGGTGSGLGAIRRVADAYLAQHPGNAIEVLPSLGTGGGIAALLAGHVDIALTARMLNAQEHDRGLRDQVYAMTPLVFATHRGTGATGVTLAEACAIFRGTQTAWPNGTPIRPVRRPPDESDTEILRDHAPELSRALDVFRRRPGMTSAATDQDNADALEAVIGSFGQMSLGQLIAENRRLTPLSLDGIVPTPAALAGGRYPLAKGFCAATTSRPRPEAGAFVDFLLGSGGAAVLAAMGHIPPTMDPNSAPHGGVTPPPR